MKYKAISLIFFTGALIFTPISAYVSVPLLLSAFIFLLISRYRITLNLLDKMQFALMGAVFLATIFAVYKGHSLLCSVIFIGYILFYFLARSLLNDEKSVIKIVDWLSYTTLIISIIGIVQYFTKFNLVIKDVPVIVLKGERISSICFNPLILASYLAFVLPIFVAFFIKGYKRVILGATICLGLVAFFFTVSRGPTIGLIVSITVLIYLLVRKKLIAVIFPIALIVMCFMFTPLRTRFIKTVDPSTDIARKVTLVPGIRMWKNHSILTGVGVHNFYLLYEKYCFPEYGRRPPYIHCMYLNFLVETGIVGLSILIAIFIIIIRWSWQIYKSNSDFKKWIAAALFSSFLGFLIHNIVDNTPYVAGLGFLFWAGMGVISGIHQEQSA
ncbi:MAG: O-antigen ligase family protein [bacterium]|nr:O-antigen ligase family protein [bacterium]